MGLEVFTQLNENRLTREYFAPTDARRRRPPC
jgi:hypothetical protein